MSILASKILRRQSLQLKAVLGSGSKLSIHTTPICTGNYTFPEHLHIERFEPMGINPGHKPEVCETPEQAIQHVRSGNNIFVSYTTISTIQIIVINISQIISAKHHNYF